MKKKLNIAFALITISLAAIVIFQFYWTLNAYRVNKSRFDTDIDVAMQRAMDDCKKDYFDSLRRVLVKHLSPPETTIQLDTFKKEEGPKSMITVRLKVGVVPRDTASPEFGLIMNDGTFSMKRSDLDFYRKKISHYATVPELITEMSFYAPYVMQKVQWYFISPPRPQPLIAPPPAPVTNVKAAKPYFKLLRSGRLSITVGKGPNGKPTISFNRLFPVKKLSDSARAELTAKHSTIPGGDTGYDTLPKRSERWPFVERPKIAQLKSSAPKVAVYDSAKTAAEVKEQLAKVIIHQYPLNYRKADSLRLCRYLTAELKKMNSYSPFQLHLATHADTTLKLPPNTSRTAEYNYRYHGFRIFNIVTTAEFFVSASFQQVRSAVIRKMMFTLILSVLLIILTAVCFSYVTRIILQQKKLADLKDDFINNMTHELNTPIATITVAIEGLQKFNALNDPEKTQRYLQTSRNELSRLNDLVTKVLNIATFENKNIDLHLSQINIDELIGELVAAEKAKAVKTVNITYHNKDQVQLIQADQFHFRNLLSNLLDNAVKYSGDPVDIAVTCYRQAGQICISVKDNGIGIAPADLHSVFDKFYRVPTGNIHNVKGTGLGLSYVKFIAEAHGGHVEAKSEINSGTEFTVYLPLSNG